MTDDIGVIIVYYIAQLFYYIAQLCNTASPLVPISTGGRDCRRCCTKMMEHIINDVHSCNNVDVLKSRNILIASHLLDHYLDYVECVLK